MFFFFLFLLIFYLFITQADFLTRIIYPFYYRQVITREAKRNNLEPLLVAAVVWVESSFKKEAESAKGAKGLMQIMPETGFWVAEQMGMENFTEKKLFDPEVNIIIGTWYLGDLFRHFNGNPYAALAAYNGGRGHVRQWLREGVWDGSKDNIAAIPFPETRLFVVKVEQTYQRYRQIYKNSDWLLN